MLIPHLSSSQLKNQPDQTVATLNRVIDAINELQNKK